jgi:hypothetical protein
MAPAAWPGGGDLAPLPARRSPSSGAATLLPLGTAGIFSILAPSPDPNQMGKSKRFHDLILQSGKVTLINSFYIVLQSLLLVSHMSKYNKDISFICDEM